MKKLRNIGNEYHITNRKKFLPDHIFKTSTIKKCFDFSWDMTFGKEGEHRDHRSGGQYGRKNGELFINTFQGKLAECGVYGTFYVNEIKLSEPDFETYGLGEWDDSDFTYNGLDLSVKSTTHFGNLLLLETKDWNDSGKYLPNDKAYDYHILVRISPDGKGIMKAERLMFSMTVEKEKLWDIISKEKWKFEVTGYITKQDLIKVIRDGFILPQNSKLNGKTKMDAENYYIQTGDMRDISLLISELKG